MTVCLSVPPFFRREFMGNQRTDIYEIWYLENFRMPVKNMTRITGTLHAANCTYMVTCVSVIVKMGNVPGNLVEKIKIHILASVPVFRKWYSL
jgi:hypothetical protein